MAQRWNTVLRQILLRGNFFAGTDSLVLAAYNTALQNNASMNNNKAEYPFEAVVDGTLQALIMMIQAIGENRESEYRGDFLDATGNIASGGSIPLFGSLSTRIRYGRISDVRDAASGIYLTHQPRTLVEIGRSIRPRRKLTLHHYFTDDVRVWHTRPQVVAECVTFDKAAERTNMLTLNDTTNCPLAEGLLPVLELGALAFIWRDTFNIEQAVRSWIQFKEELNKIAGKPMASAELPMKA